jgi:hypothetical protein
MQSEIENLPEFVQTEICRYWSQVGESFKDEAFTFLRGMAFASIDNQGLFSEILLLQNVLTMRLRIHHNLPDRVEA